MNLFTHLDSNGDIKMVDIKDKPVVLRRAVASGNITCHPKTIEAILDSKVKKGNVLTTAKIAGIQAAKQTGQLIPLCHPLNLSHININTEIAKDSIVVQSEVICEAKTGVEMEALTATSVALLTIYDMCKAIDKTMLIKDIHLDYKSKEALKNDK